MNKIPLNKMAFCLAMAGSLASSLMSGCAATRIEAPQGEAAAPPAIKSASADASQQARTYAEVEKRTRLKDYWFP